jgi:hypothetical protein
MAPTALTISRPFWSGKEILTYIYLSCLRQTYFQFNIQPAFMEDLYRYLLLYRKNYILLGCLDLESIRRLVAGHVCCFAHHHQPINVLTAGAQAFLMDHKENGL